MTSFPIHRKLLRVLEIAKDASMVELEKVTRADVAVYPFTFVQQAYPYTDVNIPSERREQGTLTSSNIGKMPKHRAHTIDAEQSLADLRVDDTIVNFPGV